MAKAGKAIKKGAEWVRDKVTDAATWVVEHTMPGAAKEIKKTAAQEAKDKIDSDTSMTEEEKQARKNAIDELANDPNSGSNIASANEGGIQGIENNPVSALENAGYGPDGGYANTFDKAKKTGENRIASEQEQAQAQAARDARNATAAIEDVSRRAAYDAARNTGANRAASSAIGGSNTPAVGSQMQSALRNAGSSTQNDYLSKMGYANAAAMEASNKQKGAFLTGLGGMFQGAGTGAQTGMSLAGVGQ